MHCLDQKCLLGRNGILSNVPRVPDEEKQKILIQQYARLKEETSVVTHPQLLDQISLRRDYQYHQ